ncbi:keratinocyte-associated protein 3 [Engraulis encrasicolus]|uniref:keratinocyte-associated protein 3 n=1 Tax=Engraulis encrasicolus TaxID=184585 RepID=UPI002FD4B601
MCGFDKESGPGRLMKQGLILILVGHVNFIMGAIVHGSILRHISRPKGGDITTEYTAVNIISVSSGLLSIVSGIVAILVSRNLPVAKLHVGLVVCSLLNALLSAACCVGLLLAISVTVGGEGRDLMAGCNSSDLPINARAPITVDCPFDTTRIYDTTLALWFPCLLLAAMETGLSVWCLVVALTLLGVGPCGHAYRDQLGEEGESLAKTKRTRTRTRMASPPLA